MPRRRGLRPRLLAAVVRSKATLAFAAERQVVIRTATEKSMRTLVRKPHEGRSDSLVVVVGMVLAACFPQTAGADPQVPAPPSAARKASTRTSVASDQDEVARLFLVGPRRPWDV